MAYTTPTSASPRTIMLGIDDQSGRQLPVAPVPIPTHLPKYYLWTQKGPLTPELVDGVSRIRTFGETSFDLQSKWANHATVYANESNSAANACMIERIMPDDAPPAANLRLYVDILPQQLPEYEYNSDGSIKEDSDGKPIETGATHGGLKYKWVSEYIGEPDATDPTRKPWAQGVEKPGTITDTTTNTQSQRIPVMDLEVSSFGEWGNGVGFRLFAPTVRSNEPVDPRIIQLDRFYPVRASILQRADEQSSARVTRTMNGMEWVDVSFKPKAFARTYAQKMGFGDVFVKAYQQLDVRGQPNQYSPFGRIFMYDDNIRQVLEMMYLAEEPFFDHLSDCEGIGEEEWFRMNMVSARNSSNAPYKAVRLVNQDSDAVFLTENSVTFASGGGDGTMDDDIFAKLVSEKLNGYIDPANPVQNAGENVESIFYDSGFPLETKYDIFKFIGLRKDTACVVSTHDVNGVSMTPAQESSVSRALRTRAQMYPESTYFGTMVARAMIVAQNGEYIRSEFDKRLPLSAEICFKAGRYMGASSRIWDNEFRFDGQPGSSVDYFTDVSNRWVPTETRIQDWANGLVWAETAERGTLFFPGLQTIYENDTSVLNSFFTMMACVEIQKVHRRSWVQLSGNSHLSEGQFCERVEEWILGELEGKFDNRFVLRPICTITGFDKESGFSWTCTTQVYAAGMRTVGTFAITTHRLSDLPEDTART